MPAKSRRHPTSSYEFYLLCQCIVCSNAQQLDNAASLMRNASALAVMPCKLCDSMQARRTWRN